jgi:transporter family-2 protein
MPTPNITFFYGVCAAILAGCVFTSQMAIEAKMKQTLGSPIPIATLAFGVGFILLLAWCFFYGINPLPAQSQLPQFSWYNFLGGPLRLIFLVLFVYAANRTGLGYATCALVAAQILSSIIIDHYGFFGAQIQKIDTQKIVGCVFLILGVAFVVFKNK